MNNPYEGTVFQKVLEQNLQDNWGKQPSPEEYIKKEGEKDEKDGRDRAAV